MTEQEMRELARAAAHSAVVTKFSHDYAVSEESTVDYFFRAYEYAMKKLYEKQQQIQNQSFQEFGSEENSNAAKFR